MVGPPIICGQMLQPAQDIVPPQQRDILSLSPRRARNRPLTNLVLIGLTAFGSCWAALAACALWHGAATVEGLLARVGMATSSRRTRADSFEVPLAQPTLPSPPAIGEQLAPGESRADLAPLHEAVEDSLAKPMASGSPAEIAYRGAACTDVFVYIVTLSEHSPRRSAV